MLVSWYLPNLEFSLWPCAVLFLVFIPVSLWHERNWRRTLDEYAQARCHAGAPDAAWPTGGLSNLMGVQPGLILLVCGLLGIVVAVAAGAALIWPQTPPGFDLAINPLDLPFIWTMVVAGTAAVVAGVAIAVDIMGNPWSRVAKLVRRAIYARPDVRAQLFAEALTVDPELRRVEAAMSAADGSTAVPPAAEGPAAAPLAAVPRAAEQPAPEARPPAL